MDEEWYYCVDHDQVEPKMGCRITNRLGPYPTRAAAEKALQQVERRNDAWENDPDWNEETE